ncbi:hypothetical protein PR001_g20056 [Phytophthora rubi]|uniref:Uncharacterized protein n=1 Tax=Phytophthora rubi TaxID=129364 RepID=A0A6A3JL82_9STRA|nr:hypothetical protein PR001_g20056 [Phytophthora rubi]
MDARLGTDQTLDDLWKRVTTHFKGARPEGLVLLDARSLGCKWSEISSDVKRFASAKDEAPRRSAATYDDEVKDAQEVCNKMATQTARSLGTSIVGGFYATNRCGSHFMATSRPHPTMSTGMHVPLDLPPRDESGEGRHQDNSRDGTLASRSDRRHKANGSRKQQMHVSIMICRLQALERLHKSRASEASSEDGQEEAVSLSTAVEGSAVGAHHASLVTADRNCEAAINAVRLYLAEETGSPEDADNENNEEIVDSVLV